MGLSFPEIQTCIANCLPQDNKQFAYAFSEGIAKYIMTDPDGSVYTVFEALSTAGCPKRSMEAFAHTIWNEMFTGIF